MYTTTTQRRRTGTALATGVTAALALSAVAAPAAFAQPADPIHTAAADAAREARGSSAPLDLRTPDAADAADETRPAATASATSVKVVRAGHSSDNGFDWGDAAIGAGGTLAAIVLGAGGAVALTRRYGRPIKSAKPARAAL